MLNEIKFTMFCHLRCLGIKFKEQNLILSDRMALNRWLVRKSCRISSYMYISKMMKCVQSEIKILRKLNKLSSYCHCRMREILRNSFTFGAFILLFALFASLLWQKDDGNGIDGMMLHQIWSDTLVYISLSKWKNNSSSTTDDGWFSNEFINTALKFSRKQLIV